MEMEHRTAYDVLIELHNLLEQQDADAERLETLRGQMGVRAGEIARFNARLREAMKAVPEQNVIRYGHASYRFDKKLGQLVRLEELNPFNYFLPLAAGPEDVPEDRFEAASAVCGAFPAQAYAERDADGNIHLSLPEDLDAIDVEVA